MAGPVFLSAADSALLEYAKQYVKRQSVSLVDRARVEMLLQFIFSSKSVTDAAVPLRLLNGLLHYLKMVQIDLTIECIRDMRMEAHEALLASSSQARVLSIRSHRSVMPEIIPDAFFERLPEKCRHISKVFLDSWELKPAGSTYLLQTPPQFLVVEIEGIQNPENKHLLELFRNKPCIPQVSLVNSKKDIDFLIPIILENPHVKVIVSAGGRLVIC
jgi:hypothetical protein